MISAAAVTAAKNSKQKLNFPNENCLQAMKDGVRNACFEFLKLKYEDC